MYQPLRRTALRSVVAALAGVALIGGTALTVGMVAAPTAGAAAAHPVWEPDLNSVGGLTFYSSTGDVITGGSLTAKPIAAYVEGNATIRAGDTKATLYAYTPKLGQTPGQWSGYALGASTSYPNSSAPAPLNTSTLPVETGSAADLSLKTYTEIYQNKATTSTYKNYYVLRLKTTATNKPQNTTYDSADILVTTTNSTWSVAYTPATVAVSVTPSDPAYGQTVTYAATVTGSGATPTGSVTFKQGTTTLCTATLSSGSGSCTSSAANVGNGLVTATYPGDSNYLAQTGTGTLDVSRAATTTSLSSSANPSASGQAVTFTATVAVSSPGVGTPTGTVVFKNGSTTLATEALATVSGSQQASYTPSPALTTSGSPYSITAAYNGGTTVAPSTSSAVSQVIDKAATTTSLSSSLNPSVSGQAVTFTATVAVNSPGVGMPTGTVVFKNGSTTLATEALATVSGSQQASYTPSPALTASGSPYSITAVYNGDANDSTSTSSAVSQVTNEAATTTSLASSVNPSQSGQSVTFTATVAVNSPGVGTPTGTVVFKNGSTTLATEALATASGSQQASYTPSPALTASGSPYSITAVYNGDANDSTSTSSAVSQVTSQAATTTSLASSVNPSQSGQSVTFTATVAATSPGSGVPTGTVIFKDGSTQIGTGTLNGSGIATFATSSLSAPASHSITAVYQGDDNYVTSTSSAVTQVVAVDPDAPAAVTASAGNTSATVSFTPGSDDGGAPITGYTVTATDATTPANGGQTATGTASPVTVTGLTNGDSYTFTVTATNSAGLTSPASSPSTPVTPAPPAPPAAPAGSTASEQATSSSPSGTATATLPGNSASATGTGAGSFTVSQYGGNPTTGSVGGTTGGYFDLQTAPGSLFSSVSLTVCVTDVTSLSWWNGSAWVPFSQQTAANGCVTATVTSSTSPNLSQLTGTPVVALTTVPTPPPPPPPAPTQSGYDLVGSDGGVFVFPTGQSGGYYGSLPGLGVSVNDIVGMVPTANDQGYFLVGADGGVFAFGNAPFEGSLPGIGVSVHDIVGIVPSSDDNGYFLVGADGGVFAFGDATYEGSLPGDGISTSSVVGIASTPDNHGYWVALANGTVYNFGSAGAYGSASSPSPISGIAGTPDGGGYWLVSQNGSVYAYGDAQNYGTLPGLGVTPNKPVVGIVPTADQKGYWLIGADGGVFAFGDAPSVGSLPGLGLSVNNIVGAVPTKY